MKILHCIFSFNAGGAETMLIDIINQQVQTHDVGLCIINDVYNTGLLSKISKKCKILLINRKESSRNVWDIIKLNTIVYSFHPQIVHCHNSRIINYLPLRIFYKTILTVHSTRLPLLGAKKYDHIIAISQAVSQDVCERGIKKTAVVHNGIEVKEIASKESSFLSNKTHCRIVQVGRLDHVQKGQHLLIEALDIIAKNKNRFPANITIDFIGVGNSQLYLENLVSECELKNSIHFLGLKDREYIYSHLKDYDLLVQPSLNEGFGLTIAEGMVAGLPVLVSDIKGPLEVIDNGKYGYTFRYGDALSLAQQIEYIVQHPSEAHETAIQGQKYAIRNYDVSNMVTGYDHVYKDVVNNIHNR